MYSSRNIIRVMTSRRVRWTGTWHAWEGWEMHTKC